MAGEEGRVYLSAPVLHFKTNLIKLKEIFSTIFSSFPLTMGQIIRGIYMPKDTGRCLVGFSKVLTQGKLITPTYFLIPFEFMKGRHLTCS